MITAVVDLLPPGVTGLCSTYASHAALAPLSARSRGNPPWILGLPLEGLPTKPKGAGGPAQGGRRQPEVQ